jgi:uncharacterized protein YuzE
MEKLKGKLIFDYDSENDVLYSYINKPRKAMGKDTNNGITLSIDPYKKKVVGFTIVDYVYKMKHGIIKSVPYFKNIDLPRYGLPA